MSRKKREVKHKDLSYLEDVFGSRRRFMSFEAGARLFSMGNWSFRQLAKKANANLVVCRHKIVDINKIEAYIENYRVEGDGEDES